MSFNPCFRRCGSKCKSDKRRREEPGSYLKFSGIITFESEPQVTYLGDAGSVEIGSEVVAYPAARRAKLKDLAVNITPAVVVPGGGSVVIQLYRNGAAVPGFQLTWAAGVTLGLKTIRTDRLKLSRGDLFALRVTLTNLSNSGPLLVAATVGVL
jgi:hypothetical protein